MKQSLFYIPTLREAPSDAEINSHKTMIRGGYIKQIAAGIYTYLPLAYKILRKIENIIRDELNELGCSELLMPALQPKDLWLESGRWNEYGSEMIRLKDRKDRDFCLGPTHEEIISYITRDYLNSYKKLPLALYQIQNKFRDELRPRYGLMRGREFIMKDLYTFHETVEDLNKWYDELTTIYKKIFKRCGLDVKVVQSETGQIGGDEAHEFMVVSEVGEDVICYSTESDFGANIEKINLKKGDPSPDGKGVIDIAKGIEVGNIFKIGTKYSSTMNCNFIDAEGNKKEIIMGCYGIGISRVLMAVLEQHSTENKVIWPEELAPFQVHLVTVNMNDEPQYYRSLELYDYLKEHNIEVLWDDRKERAGVKFKDADLIGIKHRITVGKRAEEGIVEFKDLSDDSVIETKVTKILDLIKKV